MEARHSVTREGLIAGAIGATGVALWFLIVDTIAGQPFHTPTVLGSALLSVLGPARGEGAVTFVSAYTIFHYAVFAGLGVLLMYVVHRAVAEPSMLAVFLILFIIFELGFYGLVAILAETRFLGALAWYQVAVGNVVAATLMGGYVWRAHPALSDELAHAFGSGE
ncbi:MAG: hypothetical protein ACT4PJ_13575 [Gemmatimonadaceae bacterium]